MAVSTRPRRQREEFKLAPAPAQPTASRRRKDVSGFARIDPSMAGQPVRPTPPPLTNPPGGGYGYGTEDSTGGPSLGDQLLSMIGQSTPPPLLGAESAGFSMLPSGSTYEGGGEVPEGGRMALAGSPPENRFGPGLEWAGKVGDPMGIYESSFPTPMMPQSPLLQAFKEQLPGTDKPYTEARTQGQRLASEVAGLAPSGLAGRAVTFGQNLSNMGEQQGATEATASLAGPSGERAGLSYVPDFAYKSGMQDLTTDPTMGNAFLGGATGGAFGMRNPPMGRMGRVLTAAASSAASQSGIPMAGEVVSRLGGGINAAASLPGALTGQRAQQMMTDNPDLLGAANLLPNKHLDSVPEFNAMPGVGEGFSGIMPPSTDEFVGGPAPENIPGSVLGGEAGGGGGGGGGRGGYGEGPSSPMFKKWLKEWSDRAFTGAMGGSRSMSLSSSSPLQSLITSIMSSALPSSPSYVPTPIAPISSPLSFQGYTTSGANPSGAGTFVPPTYGGAGGAVFGRHQGGPIEGPGILPGADVPAILQEGEMVMSPQASDMFRPLLEKMNRMGFNKLRP